MICILLQKRKHVLSIGISQFGFEKISLFSYFGYFSILTLQLPYLVQHDHNGEHKKY